MSTPSPGPWYYTRLATPDYAPEFGIYAEGWAERDIARVVGPNSEANATLIAAAPELLRALTALLDVPEFDGTWETSVARRAAKKDARAVITEIEGA